MAKQENIEYAIVDIETTGGYASGSGITEIAILIHDGKRVVQRYEQLLDPQMPIPLHIQALTGIDDTMVAGCPTFADVSEEIHSILSNRIFVAHNVNFDYSFIRHHLAEAGLEWSANKLCTVRMSRKIRPGLRSYSLGRLCDALKLPIENRHRAGGDAEATAILFGRLLEWDDQNIINEMLKARSAEQRLPPNLPKKHFDDLPNRPGVYYFRNRQGKAVYIGKAVNLKKRVASHFTGNTPNPQRQHFLRDIYSITYEICGTELMAFLLECIEIKRLWPLYNRALKRFEAKFALYSYEDQNGYMRLAVGKKMKQQSCLQSYNRAVDAVSQLNTLIHDFDLDRKLCVFGLQHHPYQLNIIQEKDAPSCSVDIHNERVMRAIASLQKSEDCYVIIDKGRNEDEKSCIWVEDGQFHSMGYISTETDLRDPEDIRDCLSRYPTNHYIMQLIQSFAKKYPWKVKTQAEFDKA